MGVSQAAPVGEAHSDIGPSLGGQRGRGEDDDVSLCCSHRVPLPVALRVRRGMPNVYKAEVWFEPVDEVELLSLLKTELLSLSA